jgi:hypothetical protein
MGLWQLGRVNLDWKEPGPQFGLHVTMRRRPLGEVTDLWEAEAEPRDTRRWAELTGPEQAARAKEQAAELAGLIIEWNVGGRGDKVAPVSAESLLRYCDFETINAIWAKYAEGTTRVAPPLSSSSADGQLSAETELQLPMEPLSDSPQ